MKRIHTGDVALSLGHTWTDFVVSPCTSAPDNAMPGRSRPFPSADGTQQWACHEEKDPDSNARDT
jgi:hypothetical protein